MSRRLAAIMFTDLVGFTRLGQDDEEAALRLRREHQALLRPIFGTYAGREVKSLGDGFLVEFPSAVESVRCAVEIQRAMGERNARAGPEDRMLLRIGIHLGDIVEEEGGDLVGDAVNVASRIEPLADPGGICLSAPVHDQVRNKLPYVFERLGPRTLKNVREAVEVYRIADPSTRVVAPPKPEAATTHFRLAVLPLANLSAEANDDFFADGLTDELISRTAQLDRVRVIARTSVQRYKGSPKTIREVGQELDVGAALEGSVRKAGDQLRIAVQLIDVRSESNIWSMRYDRPLGDIFAIQDDIAGHVARAVATHLTGSAPPGPVARPDSAPPDTADLEAYAVFLHGRQLFAERGSVESIRAANSLFEDAVRRDPLFARARVGVAESLLWLATEGQVPFREAESRAHRELQTALARNDRIAEAHSTLAALYLGTDRLDDCEREARRAMELNPSLADPYRWLAQLAAGDGDIDEAVRLLDAARQLDPTDVNILAFYGRALAYSGREADALAFWESTMSRVRFRTNANLAEYFLGKGDLPHAEESVREMEQIRPDSPWTLVYRGLVAARSGETDVARRNLERLHERAKRGEMLVFFIGFLQYGLGDQDGFVAAMDQALRLGVLPLLELTYSPLYAAARADPRVQDILERQRRLRQRPPSGGGA